MEIDSDRRSYCHGEIVAQSVEANAFVAAAGRQDINGAGTVGNGYGAKRSAMQGSADGKHQDGAGSNVSCKEDGEGCQADHQYFLSRESVYHIAAEGADDEGCHSISAQYNADYILRCPEGLTQIEREQRGEKIEGEVEQEIGRHHLHIVSIPKFLFHLLLHSCFLFRTKVSCCVQLLNLAFQPGVNQAAGNG